MTEHYEPYAHLRAPMMPHTEVKNLSETNQARAIAMLLTDDENARIVGYLSGEPHMADALDFVQSARDYDYKRHVMTYSDFGSCSQCGHPLACDRKTSMEPDVPNSEIYVVCSIGDHPDCDNKFILISTLDNPED